MSLKEKILILLPIILIFSYFFLFPLMLLVLRSFDSSEGLTLHNYILIFTTPYYLNAIRNSIGLSASVTIATLIISGVLAFFLARTKFPGKSLYFSVLTFPISFPGVVVGFMIIILFGSTGIIPMMTQKLFGVKLLSISYTIMGIFLSYLYFEVPRIVMTLYGAITECDTHIEQAARTLGANEFQAVLYVVLPSVFPIFISAGALAFSTSMSAFGTAFTLANQFNILPILMYNEFTVSFNMALASSISVVIGVVCILMSYCYRILVERRKPV